MASPGKPVQILIVEDNDPDVFLVEEALRSHGILVQMERCHDGEEAIRALSQVVESHLPNLIIIDLNLPKVTGIEILKHVRSLKQLDGVPVLVLTSSQSRSDRALSLQLGADAYIAKPPTLPEFLSAVGSGIRSLLEQSGEKPASRLRPSTCSRAQRRIRLFTFQSARQTRGARVRRTL